jgi:hypothetical protein
LAQTQVPEADAGQHLEPFGEPGCRREERNRFLDGELEDLVDIKGVVADLEDT